MVELELLQTASYLIAALSFAITCAYYIMNLKNTQKNMQMTLETRQAQMFMNIYDQTKTRDFQQAWVKVISSDQWNTVKEYFELNKDSEFHVADNTLAMFFEGIGVLVREGLLDVRMIALLMCGMTQRYWGKFSMIVEGGRKEMGYVRFMSETEYLYGALMKYLSEHPELDTRIEKGKMDVT